MWHVHPFSQGNKTSKIPGGVKVGSNGKIWGSLRNIGGARNPGPTITHKELLGKGCSGSLGKMLETTCKEVHF